MEDGMLILKIKLKKIIIKPNINRRYFAMKFLKDLHKSMARHVEYLEETMAEYVGFHDRVRCWWNVQCDVWTCDFTINHYQNLINPNLEVTNMANIMKNVAKSMAEYVEFMDRVRR